MFGKYFVDICDTNPIGNSIVIDCDTNGIGKRKPHRFLDGVPLKAETYLLLFLFRLDFLLPRFECYLLCFQPGVECWS